MDGENYDSLQQLWPQALLCLDSKNGGGKLGGRKPLILPPLSRFAGLPELNLFRHIFWFGLGCGRALNDVGAFPLCPRHENGAHTALWREVFLQPFNVRFLPCE